MILVTTPTGKIGRQVLRQLMLASPGPLRVLVRDPGKLPPASVGRVDVVVGSIEDPAVLQRALAGVQAVFWCQPDAPAAPDYLGYYTDLAAKAREALRHAGVARVVAISAAGNPRGRPAGPITALHSMEAVLAESGVALRSLRCGSFFENLLWQWDTIVEQGRFTYSAPGHIPSPQLATSDIAAVAARWLQQPDWSGVHAIPLPGPEDLSYDQMAQELSRQLQRPVSYEPMPAADYRELLISLGQSPSAAQALVDMFAFLTEDYAPEPPAARADTPTTFRQWLQRESAGSGSVS